MTLHKKLRKRAESDGGEVDVVVGVDAAEVGSGDVDVGAGAGQLVPVVATSPLVNVTRGVAAED